MKRFLIILASLLIVAFLCNATLSSSTSLYVDTKVKATHTHWPTHTPRATKTPKLTKTPRPTKMPKPTKTATPVANPSVTLTPTVMTCDPRHSFLRTPPFGYTIFNESIPNFTISINNIYVWYNNSNGQYINALWYFGELLWSGENHNSPAAFHAPFLISTDLPAGANAFLSVQFISTYVPNGSERLDVTFAQSGCPTLDSSVSGQLP